MRRPVPAARLTILPLLAATLAACGAPPATPQPPVAAVPPPAVAALPPSPTPAPTAAPTATTAPTIAPTSEPTLEPTPEPTLEPTARPDISAVTGESSFARGAITQRPWMVMIDNHPDAYPQSGLDQASVVFEGLAEYGVTRFIALYQDGVSDEVGEIGPVRSTRLYFGQWAMGFHPVYAYAGGSPDGIRLAESTDQFVKFDALQQKNYTWRDRKRGAPHNLYTSSKLLRAFANDKQVVAFNDSTVGYLFESIAPSVPPTVTRLDYYFLNQGSRAGFVYDPATNGYYRSMRGQPHIDRVSGKRLWTRNVVVMQVDESLRPGDEKRRIDQEVIGLGQARVFNAGRSFEATWRKDSAAAPLRFYDADNKEVVFNSGPIWIAAIPAFNRLTQR